MSGTGSEWQVLQDAAGEDYAYNASTKETRWLWQRHVDPASQRAYRHNFLTGETQWEPGSSSPVVSPSPSPGTAKHAKGRAMPNGEVLYTTESGRQYLHNPSTGQSKWLSAKQQEQQRGARGPGSVDPAKAKQLLLRAARALKPRLVLEKLRLLRGMLHRTAEKIREACGLSLADLDELEKQYMMDDADLGKSTLRPADAMYLLKQLTTASEIVTQHTISVDEINADGSDAVRVTRKLVIKQMLALGERFDALKLELQDSCVDKQEAYCVQNILRVLLLNIMHDSGESAFDHTKLFGLALASLASGGILLRLWYQSWLAKSRERERNARQVLKRGIVTYNAQLAAQQLVTLGKQLALTRAAITELAPDVLRTNGLADLCAEERAKQIRVASELVTRDIIYLDHLEPLSPCVRLARKRAIRQLYALGESIDAMACLPLAEAITDTKSESEHLDSASKL
ncbi:hypothetical protein FVE85_2463 [Porphyridium purpureum]|uniref:WW domain-containing protein n=1 Tax=Porphyridium purpureum TaxID=35688 RepID=A0A5J4YJP2_PORPP|nr:hypothetical protein FVE85_2463 [Porphyridium purpureum]|eukprot:POR4552..scf291_13